MEDFIAESLQITDSDSLFDQIMTDYGQDILQLTYSYVKNPTLAEDLTQEIFVKCYQALPTFKGHSNIRTWLWRIAINHCKDYLKSWHHRKITLAYENDVEPSSPSDQLEKTIIQMDETSELIDAVLQLPVKYREPIYLHYFQELSLKEIEALINVKQNTIKTRLRRAKALLKESLGG